VRDRTWCWGTEEVDGFGVLVVVIGFIDDDDVDDDVLTSLLFMERARRDGKCFGEVSTLAAQSRVWQQ